MFALSKNIPDIQIYTGSFKSFSDNYVVENIYFKEHPINVGYSGNKDVRDWITEEVSGYYPSFFTYWKKVEKRLYK
jgi:deoxyribodipyrimidine photo-lyase